jgi:hypothetical protein
MLVFKFSYLYELQRKEGIPKTGIPSFHFNKSGFFFILSFEFCLPSLLLFRLVTLAKHR